jgi:hypothetical protein
LSIGSDTPMRLWADSVMVALLGSTPLYDRLRTIVHTLQHPSRLKSVSGRALVDDDRVSPTLGHGSTTREPTDPNY